MRWSLVFRAAGASIAALLVAKALLSCVDLASLGNGPPDAPAPTEAAAAEAGDPCSHAQPPAPPDLGGRDPSELPTFVLALDEVTLDPTKVKAFDLDGVCTCDARPGTARDGGPSCVSSSVTCDGDGGADDALGVVAAAASPLVAVDGIFLLQIAKYTGSADDDEVVVGSLLAEGIRSQGCPASTFDSTAMVWSRGGCGDDPWTVSPSAVVATGSAALPLVVGTGYVRDYQLVVRFKDAARVPFDDESTTRIGAPLLTGHVVPLDETLAPRDPARSPTKKEQRLFRIEGGVLAGRVLATDLLATLGTYRKSGAAPLCASSGFETVRSIICGATDITGAPSADPTVKCDALSTAIGFVAIPAVEANVADAAVTSTACDSVDASLLACP
jgi:hypothetical protein